MPYKKMELLKGKILQGYKSKEMLITMITKMTISVVGQYDVGRKNSYHE